MPPVALVMPGRLDARTGGSIYDRRITEGLHRRGWPVTVVELDASFPFPTTSAIEQADRALAALPAGTITIIDSLALGAMPDLVDRESTRLRVVALMHLPLAADPGFERNIAARFEATEREALRAAALVVVTGKATVHLLDQYDLDPERIIVVEPGTDRLPLARGSSGDEPLALLSVATVHAGKGHESLVEALAAVPHRSWRLTCAGSLTRDPATAERVRATVTRLGLDDRVAFVGDLDGSALHACYNGSDVFVLATRRETYGMAVAEALAHGLPVVATKTGAIPELVGDDAGVLVPVDDTPALIEALTHVLGDDRLRARLAAGARRVRERLLTWDEAAGRMVAALELAAIHD